MLKFLACSSQLDGIDFAPRFEAHDEVRADSELALHIDRAAVCEDDLLADTEAETDTFFVQVLRIPDLAKVAKQALLILFRNADARVPERDLEFDLLFAER